jgi:hypothetical protein
MKKKLLAGTISAVLLFGSIQAYAVTTHDTNIFNLITDGIGTIRDYYIAAADKDADSLEKQYTNKISQLVKDKTSKVIKEIETHKNNEVGRANQELDAYFKTLEKDVDTAADEQVKQTKSSITGKVNKNIEDIKTLMNIELEKNIKNILKK